MTDYKYYLLYNDVETEVLEPIGWDAFESKIVRSEEYHGISAEFVDDGITVKFDDVAAIGVIKAAYIDDVANLVTFIVRYKDVEEYRGQIDFNVYKDVYDSYHYIEVTITELDKRADFFKRIETKVDLDNLTAFDGAVLPPYPHLRDEIEMPAKTMEQISEAILSEESEPVTINSFGRYASLFLPFGGVELSEISTLTPGYQFTLKYGYPSSISHISTFTNNYDADSKLACSSGMFTLKVTGDFRLQYVSDSRPTSVNISFYIYKMVGNDLESLLIQDIYNGGAVPDTFLFSIPDNELEITLNPGEKISTLITVNMSGGSDPAWYSVTALKTSFKVSILSVCEDTYADISHVHEVFSRITEAYTDGFITVKSNLYGRSDSDVNPYDGVNYLALTNGLRIRNYVDLDGNKPALSLSFKELAAGIAPVDNIGYGFVLEDGNLYLRVERFEWFYQSNVIFSIDNPSKKVRSLVPKEVFSDFNIGYKKYETEGTNGLDAIMTNREYRTRQALSTSKVEKISDFVADSYAIEATRRRANDKDTKDWRYDNDVFILELSSRSGGYIIRTGNVTGTNLVDPSTLYNVGISPARCVQRWLGRLFGWSHKKEELIFTAGTGNLNASTARSPLNIKYVENQNFESGTPVFTAEIIDVEYPLTLSEFNAIKSNPYGIIQVDGEDCYLKELRYKRKNRIGNFRLLPKY